jgi:hypothetical protein
MPPRPIRSVNRPALPACPRWHPSVAKRETEQSAGLLREVEDEREGFVDGALLGCGESAGETVEAFDVDGAEGSTSTRVLSPASSICGRNVAAAALREVGATMTVESPSSWSAWTMTP